MNTEGNMRVFAFGLVLLVLGALAVHELLIKNYPGVGMYICLVCIRAQLQRLETHTPLGKNSPGDFFYRWSHLRAIPDILSFLMLKITAVSTNPGRRHTYTPYICRNR